MEPISSLSLALGAAWASGINLYACILALGLLDRFSSFSLPANLELLAHPAILSVAAVMYAIEFFADKIPGLDSTWDMIHTFIRIPAGALLAAASVGDIPEAWVVAAGLVGGAVATSSHAVKSGSRLAINTSPEPVSNWLASLSEDAAVFFGVYSALNYPWLFFALLLGFFLISAWLLPKIFRALKSALRGLSSIFLKNADTLEDT